MADPSRKSQSALKTKIVRSQKISNTTSPTDKRLTAPLKATHNSDPEEPKDGNEHVSSAPRNHASGQRPASRSQQHADRRKKPPGSPVRQHSQSSAAGLSSTYSPVPSLSFSGTLSHLPETPALPTASRTRYRSNTGDIGKPNGSTEIDKEISETTASAQDRRDGDLSSTSATASNKNGGASLALTRHVLGSAEQAPSAGEAGGVSPCKWGLPPGTYTSFPPLVDPKAAPDVPQTPASGMYWSKAPGSGAGHTALRAHTTTLIGANIYVFGGCDARACFNQLYVLDADAFHWSIPSVAGDVPSPLRAMTCTAVGRKLIVFGGGDGPAYYNDVYVLDTGNFRWSRPRIVGDAVPSKRRAHAACLYKNGVYIFGGGDGVRALNDIWRLDVADSSKMSWKLIWGPPTSSSLDGDDQHQQHPKPRGYHTANMVGSKLIIFGGSDGGECFNDVWIYDVETHVWKTVNMPVMYRRLSHSANIVGSYLFVIGGHDGTEYSNDLLLLNLVTMSWDRRKVYGLPPSGRGYHGTVLHDSRLILIGGFDGNEVFGDVWMLDLAVHAYYSQISHFTIDV